MLFVDAMNVLGSRPDGWWRDRDAALRRLVTEVDAWAARSDVAVVVVADGRPPPDLPAGRHGHVEVSYADRRGPDAADDAIVARLAACDDPNSHEVVTADRALRDRVAELGAAVSGPRSFLERIGAPGR